MQGIVKNCTMIVFMHFTRMIFSLCDEGLLRISIFFYCRHEKYVNQYRAMFVMNCTVRNDQILLEKARRPKRGRASKERISSEDPKTEAVFKPVCCSTCMTEIGVFDQEEVYHFFNVLPSEP